MRRTAVFILGFVSTLALATEATDTARLAAEARAKVKPFMMALKGELKKAMKAGGPVNAISVCHEKAPQIAARLTKETGWNMARTSLKVRNPDNAPDDWERKVLEAFEKQKAAGADVKKLEHYEIVERDGKKVFRYMKAIPTGGICLNCHGEQLKPEVAAKLDELYPKDQARGFKPGDIRGAFTFSKVLD
jgi:hypothetical protein